MPGELSDTQLDMVESKANGAVSAIRSLRNMSSPVYQVPIEVLGIIFAKLVEMQSPQGYLPDVGLISTYSPAIQPLSRVCRKWREAALAFPALWSRIYRSEGPSCLLNIERSQDAMLRVYSNEAMHPNPTVWIVSPPPSRPSSPLPDEPQKGGSIALLNALAPQAHRVEELHFLDADADVLGSVSFMNTPMPHLESLTISMNFRSQPATWGAPNIWQPDKIFDGYTPRLRQLTLHRFPSLPEQIFSGLTHLCLANQISPQRFTIGRLLDVLRASPLLEELSLIDCGPDVDDLSHDKVELPHLQNLALGIWTSPMSPTLFTDYLILFHPINFFMWCMPWESGSTLRDLFPLHTTQGEYIKELRLTSSPRDASYGAIMSPSLWRTDHQYAIISTKDQLQIDGRLEPSEFLFDAPTTLNLRGVQELWLGTSYRVEPTLLEWRTFFFSLPSLLTLVISRRSSHSVISALTLPKEDPNGDLLCPDLETLRIYNDRLLSVLRLSIFAEQRDRRNRRLKLVDVISDGRTKQGPGFNDNGYVGGYQSPTPWPPNPDGSLNTTPPSPPWPEAVVADLMHLEEYVDKVDCMRVVTDADWDVLPAWPPRSYTWLSRPGPSNWPHH
ncbi:hypothetical protein ONZ45_g6290 [Pleurotus djamor]|nr:hypothetical protein ONZ45_g6290 [Pleurotus djamor]